VINLYDVTRGNYRVRRTLSYPEYPNSQVVFDTEVMAVSEKEWSTTITVSGRYDGPTDVVAVKDYQMTWTTDGTTILERGTATLERASGGSVRSVWSSSIAPKEARLGRFPARGETLQVTFSPLKIDGNKMSYEWQGTVRASAP
jgi:hypothetical protein